MASSVRAGRFSTISTNGSTAQSSEFVDERFEVIPVPANINQASEEGPEASGTISSPVSDAYTEEDLIFLTESVVTLPSIIFPKIPPRTKEQIAPFNHQLYLYCKKKGLNPYEYFFDEFGIAMAGLGLAAGIYRDYKENYGNGAKEETRENKKLSSDFDHANKVAQQKEQDIKDGKITLEVASAP